MDSSVEAVEKILNYSFTNKNLLKEATTQTSPDCVGSSPLFKRLEFLGDAVLEVALSNHIHLTYPTSTSTSWEVHSLRPPNVSNEKFARVALNHNLYQLLKRDLPFPSLDEEVKEFTEAVSKEDGPVPYGGVVKAPKILADIVESIAGALYVDVNFDLQRFWEIFRGFLEPIFTLDDIKEQPEETYLALSRLGDKHGKRIDFRYYEQERRGFIVEVYLDDEFIAASRFVKGKDRAKLLAATEALQKLSERMPTEKINSDDNLDFENEDVKRKLFEICSSEKLQLQTRSSSSPTASENPLANEMTQAEMVMDEDSPHVEHEDSKGEFFEICSSRKLQIHTESSLLPTASVNPLTYEITTKQMVVDKDSLHVVPKDVKGKLIHICATNKWPGPVFSVDEEQRPENKQYVCSVKIEIPAIESTFHMKGDAKLSKKEAERSSAYHMIEMGSDLVEAVEKILNYGFVNKNLLKEALTHGDHSPLFKRLTFVGEPALSLAFTNYMYLMYPKLELKNLSLLQEANTCNYRYARVAVKKGIYQFFIQDALSSKKEKLERKIKEIKEFIELMGKEDDSDSDPDPYRFVKAPRYLASLVNVVAGAVYIDVDYNVQRLWEIVRGLFEPIYTPDDLRRQAHPLLTLLCFGEKHGKRIEFRYVEKGEAINAQVYIDDEFIARGGDSHKNRADAKMQAAKAALQKLSETMPIEMVMKYIEYEDAKEKLIEICNKRKWPNPIYDSVESSEEGYVYSAKIETPTKDGTLCIEGNRKRRRKVAENSSASNMIRALESPLTSLVISKMKMQKKIEKEKRKLEMQESLDEKYPQMKEILDKKKNPQMQKSLDEKNNPQMQKSLDEKKSLQTREKLDDNKNSQRQVSLDENKNSQTQESVDEKKNPQMQESLDEKKNPQMQESLDEKKNPQIQESLDENKTQPSKKRKRRR
ncbi:PREDICTED: ribonuclease 3-like protein 3 isoform X2 [Camelina sativa]|uniref:Ribonuclease 3-like protein 3 isoform X2 n=1 Tax=Camelina sativa TaxID=90675 RepID=A0ABM0UIU8_CAMSA|nr:PREDICTED: ribonuclease 3-like protein 3 isoform X2 [Camelina sativa]